MLAPFAADLGTMIEITPTVLLRAYAAGIFPMAEDAGSDELYWFDPERRGVLPIEGLHVPRSLRRTLRRRVFEVRCDTAFRRTVEECAAPRPDRERTWINGRILDLYTELHAMGHAHSVEAWRDGELVGGLYGVALGAAFFGESMFSREPDASKAALVHLCARLSAGGFTLLDTQFVTAHLGRFGAVEIPRAEYRRRLAAALQRPAAFPAGGDGDALVASFLQATTQTS